MPLLKLWKLLHESARGERRISTPEQRSMWEIHELYKRAQERDEIMRKLRYLELQADVMSRQREGQ